MLLRGVNGGGSIVAAGAITKRAVGGSLRVRDEVTRPAAALSLAARRSRYTAIALFIARRRAAEKGVVPPGLAAFAEVAVPVAVHGTFTYAIPPELRDAVRLGSRVEVPFGAKRNTGFVVGLLGSAPEGSKIKPIRAVLDDDEPALLPEIIELCRWAAEYYIAPLGEMLRVALPANMSARGTREMALVGDESMIAAAITAEQILDTDLPLIDELRRRPLPFAAALEASSRSAIERLRDAGTDRRSATACTMRKASATTVSSILETPPAGLTAKQQQAVDLLSVARRRDVGARAGDTPASARRCWRRWRRRASIRIERRARRHTLDAFLAGLDPASVGEIRHSREQTRRHRRDSQVALGTFAPFLLEGVTGSGKTEVYIELMREAVRRGEQALLLVPEISLTPVFASRLKERFGERIAILHSSLSASERYDQWWRARRGEVDVAIGPRSALFTPFQRLGVIVVDEEGDGAYKQDETPRYNARDLAVVRAQFRNIPVVLGSATPSLESRENAARGKYTLLRMMSRVESRPLPEAEVIDLRKERAEKEDKGFVIFSDPLKAALQRDVRRQASRPSS